MTTLTPGDVPAGDLLDWLDNTQGFTYWASHRTESGQRGGALITLFLNSNWPDSSDARDLFINTVSKRPSFDDMLRALSDVPEGEIGLVSASFRNGYPECPPLGEIFLFHRDAMQNAGIEPLVDPEAEKGSENEQES